MVSRWRCLRKPLNMLPDNASSVVLACCVLHNLCRSERCATYCPPGFGDIVDVNGAVIDGAWRLEGLPLEDVEATVNRNPAATAISVRDIYINYFNQEGVLHWQDQHINRV